MFFRFRKRKQKVTKSTIINITIATDNSRQHVNTHFCVKQ